MRKLFTQHPESVGETYLEHMNQGLFFSGRLFVASLACMIHALFPFFFVRTGSKAVIELHERMVSKRRPDSQELPEGRTLSLKPRRSV